MITTIVSAIKGPILSVVSGWLGESGKWWKWLRNLVPTSVGMPDVDTPSGAVGDMGDNETELEIVLLGAELPDKYNAEGLKLNYSQLSGPWASLSMGLLPLWA